MSEEKSLKKLDESDLELVSGGVQEEDMAGSVITGNCPHCGREVTVNCYSGIRYTCGNCGGAMDETMFTSTTSSSATPAGNQSSGLRRNGFC